MKRIIVQLTRSKASVMRSLPRNVLALGLLAFFLLPLGLSAQMTVTVRGGLVSSTVTGADATDPDPDSRTGFSAGASLGIPFAGRFTFSPGVHYVEKGAGFSETLGSDVLTGGFELAYFEIPLLVGVGLTGEDSPVGFSVFAGPSVAFEMSCNAFLEGTISGVDISASEECGDADVDNRRTLLIGAIAGAGAQFPVGGANLSVNAGVDFGLSKIDTSDPPEDIKHRTLFASVGVSFPIGG